MNNGSEKYKRAALLMTEFLDDLLSSTPNILDSDKDMHLNLEKIKTTPTKLFVKGNHNKRSRGSSNITLILQ